MAKILEAVVSGGMGAFLNPPTHPEHSLHVETDRNRRRCNRGAMSLSSALTADYIDPSVQKQVKEILTNWENNKLSIDNYKVQDWICRVLGYFRNCYISTNGSRSAQDLIIDPECNPMVNKATTDLHAGVAFIRDHYPEFIPTEKHFANAYWGNKPVSIK